MNEKEARQPLSEYYAYSTPGLFLVTKDEFEQAKRRRDNIGYIQRMLVLRRPLDTTPQTQITYTGYHEEDLRIYLDAVASRHDSFLGPMSRERWAALGYPNVITRERAEELFWIERETYGEGNKCVEPVFDVSKLNLAEPAE